MIAPDTGPAAYARAEAVVGESPVEDGGFTGTAGGAGSGGVI
jgi:hypothetical protein